MEEGGERLVLLGHDIVTVSIEAHSRERGGKMHVRSEHKQRSIIIPAGSYKRSNHDRKRSEFS